MTQTHLSSVGENTGLRAHQRIVRKIKKNSPPTFPSQSEASTEYASPQYTYSDSDSSKLEDKLSSTRRETGALEVIQTVTIPCRKAVDYRTYRLENRSTKWDHVVLKNISKTWKGMTAQIRTRFFKPFDRISIVGFLCIFELAYGTKGIQEGAPIWLLSFFIKHSASAVLKKRLALKHNTQTKIQ